MIEMADARVFGKWIQVSARGIGRAGPDNPGIAGIGPDKQQVGIFKIFHPYKFHVIQVRGAVIYYLHTVDDQVVILDNNRFDERIRGTGIGNAIQDDPGPDLQLVLTRCQYGDLYGHFKAADNVIINVQPYVHKILAGRALRGVIS